MTKLIILDFCTGIPYVYTLKTPKRFYERYIVKLGFKLENVQWMVTKNDIEFIEQ